MKVIGVTGPSGSGKTCMLEYLKLRGVKVINADQVYHELLESSSPMKNAVKARFGTVNTKMLGELVYTDKQELRDLENITHPFVTDAVRTQLERFRQEDVEAVIVEAIALLESDLKSLCNIVILIRADREKLISRIVMRDSVSHEYAEARLRNRDFNDKTPYIINNNGDLMSLYAQVDKIYKEVISQ